jgi:4-amino-4-deoxy-L-arabinose transferase-like glycosyltransferase
VAGRSGRELERFARGPVLAAAGTITALLLAVSGRYGYHRDELYFLAAGRHLAWGYPDQPPFVPALARLVDTIAPDSVSALRTPSAFAAGAVVIFTGLIARELGGGRAAQVLAAASMCVAAVLLGAGHLLSTTTFGLLTWAALLWLFVRILRTGQERLWLAFGVVAGAGLLVNTLVAFLAAALFAGIALVGPRRVLASPWLWAGAAVALVLWAPYLLWQARHDWPQLEVSRAIAAGDSGTSEPRALFLPFQLGLVSPYLAPVWIAGLVRLWHDARMRPWRSLAVAYVLLAVAFVVTGGKPYYLAGMFPVLLAAGAQPALDWGARGRAWLRRFAPVAAVALSVTTIPFAVPVLPLASLHRTPIASFNYDIGETVGWPTYVAQIAAVYRGLPAADRATTALLTRNYGEAGAIERYGQPFGLPTPHSGGTGYWYWGPPSSTATTVIAVGFDRGRLTRAFTDVRLATRLHNRYKIDNDEQDDPVWICTGRRAPWAQLWPTFRNF